MSFRAFAWGVAWDLCVGYVSFGVAWVCVAYGLLWAVWGFVVILGLPRFVVARLAMTARLVILSVSEKSKEFKIYLKALK